MTPNFGVIFFLLFILSLNYNKIKNKYKMTKKKTEFDIRTYSNGLLHVVIGRFYSGEGYSGITDGVIVKGKLTEIEITMDSATIWDEKLDMPCAVKLGSLNAL